MLGRQHLREGCGSVGTDKERWLLDYLHAGIKNDLLPKATLVFKAKNVGDYYNQMNADTPKSVLR